jgi:hypothetical protein
MGLFGRSRLGFVRSSDSTRGHRGARSGSSLRGPNAGFLAERRGNRSSKRGEVVGVVMQSADGGRREVVASYPRYEQAQQAVDLLSDRGFPVEKLAIEARGIRFVERVTGRMTYGRAVVQGAASGAMIGLFIGLLFSLFNWFAPAESILVLVLWGILLGAFWGALIGVAGHWMTQGRRDFTSARGMEADRYDVTADPDVVAEAGRMLAEAGLVRHDA